MNKVRIARRVGKVFRGISKARDGLREAHMDVRVAVRRKTFPTLRRRLQAQKAGKGRRETKSPNIKSRRRRQPMALISLRQLLDHAAEHGYGVPAFNVNNLEQMRAIMEAADKTDSPVIVQASAGARKYAGAPFQIGRASCRAEGTP